MHKLEVTGEKTGYCWCGWRVSDTYDVQGEFNSHLDEAYEATQQQWVVNEKVAEALSAEDFQDFQENVRSTYEVGLVCDSLNPNGGTATCSKVKGHSGEHMNRGGVW